MSLAKAPHLFFQTILSLLKIADPNEKAQGVFKLFYATHKSEVLFETDFSPPLECTAGRPEHPVLVAPKECTPRKGNGLEGRQILIHALAHIEFNAINLSLDACMRFQGLPRDYYLDWLRVAKEEAYHFLLLKTHLNSMGCDYGDFPGHNGLWEMVVKTAHDPLARMGCVPRLMEARGLDVSPGIIQKLVQEKELNAATLLEIIMRDEEHHVAIGNKWFHYLCKQRHLEPLTTFQELIQKHAPYAIRPPFAREARKRAGFSDQELDWLQSFAATKKPSTSSSLQ